MSEVMSKSLLLLSRLTVAVTPPRVPHWFVH